MNGEMVILRLGHLNLGRRLLSRRRCSCEHLLGSRGLVRCLPQPGRLTIERRRLPPELLHPVLLHAPCVLRASRQLLALARGPLLRGHGTVSLACKPTCRLLELTFTILHEGRVFTGRRGA